VDGGVDDELDKGGSTEKELAEDASSSSSSSAAAEDADDDSEHDVGLNPLPEDALANMADSAAAAESASSNVSVSAASESSLSAAETLATRIASASSSIRRPPPAPAPPSSRLQIPNDRPVILLPNGLVIYDKVSFSVAMHSAVVRGTYAGEEGHIQLIGKGVILEAIWPKINQVRVALRVAPAAKCEESLTHPFP
jgi:hypothetical protein